MDRKNMSLSLLIFCIILVTGSSSSQECKARSFGLDSVVCVCDESHCDSFPPLNLDEEKGVHVIESNKEGKRFHHSVVNFTQDVQSSSSIEITVNVGEVYQTIEGFGGAFTDAAGITTFSLPQKASQALIDSYFSPNGLDYSIGRVPIGGTDFSTRKYTYDDTNNGTEDFNLDLFSLQEEDLKFKIPLIQAALNTSRHQIKLFASAWSAPVWMKTNGDLAGYGRVKGSPGGEYYQAWARYYVKFFDAYASHNISYWGLTTGNEPINGYIPFFPFNCLGFTAYSQRDFVKKDLGPILEKAGYITPTREGELAEKKDSKKTQLKLMIMDDQRYLMPLWPKVILGDSDAAKYVWGIAFHWYGNWLSPAALLDKTHYMFPSYYLFASEATVMGKPRLGRWKNGEQYAKDILSDLLHWSVAWVDWNLSLDTEGGPNWVKNWCDSPIIVNTTSGEFYKQPQYYALGHFSKFIPPGSRRIGTSIKKGWGPWSAKITAGSFVTPDTSVVTIVINEDNKEHAVLIKDSSQKEKQFSYTLSPRSIVTFVSK